MSKRLAHLISFVLVAGLAGNTMADDLYPPDWAGAPDSTYALWQFEEDPGDLDYIEADIYEGDTEEHTEPDSIVGGIAPLGEGVVACVGGEGDNPGFEFNGDGSITIVSELLIRLNNWLNDEEGRRKRVRFQITYEPGSAAEPIDGESETADDGEWIYVPGIVRGDTSTIIADEEGFFCFEFEYEDRNPAAEGFFIFPEDLVMHELIIDTICYEGDEPPSGPGRVALDLGEDPKNGDPVDLDRTEPLSWILPDPNDLVDGIVTCDVWFVVDDDYPEAGSYSGDPNFTIYAEKIVGDVSGPEAVESVAIPVTLEESHTYYWRIDTYDDSSEEPQPVIGRVFTFNTYNQVPGVDIVGDDVVWLTDDIVVVSLSGVITDPDGPEPISLEWYVDDELVEGETAKNIELTWTETDEHVVRLTADDGADIGEAEVLITVYEDSCEAAQEGRDVELLRSDLNGDCVTDFADLAEFAGEWLENVAL